MIVKLVKKIRGKINWWFYGPKRYKHIYNTIKKIKPVNIMEVGVWNGERALRMIKLAQKYNKNINYYGFDLFEDLTDEELIIEVSKKALSINQIKDKLEKTGANITLIKGNTLESMRKNYEKLPKMDFIFIDGGHSLETIANDWKYSEKMMGDKCITIFDDYYFDSINDGAKVTVDNIDREKYTIKILEPRESFKRNNGRILNINFACVRKK